MYWFDFYMLKVWFYLSGESLDDEYGQEVPVRKPGEKVTGPPILPPHLLQVILNKDIPAHVCSSIHIENIN